MVEDMAKRLVLTGQFAELADRRASSLVKSEFGCAPGKFALYFLFGDHIITPEHIRQIGERDIDVVTGEFKKTEITDILDGWKTPEQIYRVRNFSPYNLFHPSLGVNSSQATYAIGAIRELIASGKTIITLEGSVKEAKFDGQAPPELITLMGIFGIAILTGIPIAQFIKEHPNQSIAQKDELGNGHINRRRFIQGASLLSALAVAAGGVGYAFRVPLFSVPLWKTPLNDIYEEAERAYEVLLANNGIGKRAFDIAYNISVDLRNKIVALNTWHALGRLIDTDNKQISILFTMGSAHKKAYDDFISGPRAIKTALKKYASRLCNKTVDFFIEAVDREVKEGRMSAYQAEETIVDSLAIFGRMFTTPCAFGPVQLSQTPSLGERLPDTAKGVLLAVLEEHIAALTKDPASKNQRRLSILKKLYETLLAD